METDLYLILREHALVSFCDLREKKCLNYESILLETQIFSNILPNVINCVWPVA